MQIRPVALKADSLSFAAGELCEVCTEALFVLGGEVLVIFGVVGFLAESLGSV